MTLKRSMNYNLRIVKIRSINNNHLMHNSLCMKEKMRINIFSSAGLQIPPLPPFFFLSSPPANLSCPLPPSSLFILLEYYICQQIIVHRLMDHPWLQLPKPGGQGSMSRGCGGEPTTAAARRGEAGKQVRILAPNFR